MKIAVATMISVLLTHPDLANTAVLFQNMGLNDVHFLDDVIFESDDVRSLVECAGMCARNPCCVTMTYTQSSASSGSCRGHMTTVTSASRTASVRGAKTYAVASGHPASQEDWHGVNCTTNEECPAPASECFSGRCLCSPGYYYAEGSNACVDSCPSCRLGRTLVRYPGGRLVVGTYWSMTGPSLLPFCLNTCLSDSSCRSLVFTTYWESQGCYIKNVTAMDVPDRWLQDVANHLYYQRTCN